MNGQVPSGIEEQYDLFYTFLQDPTTESLHIESPYCETPTILQVVIETWEHMYGTQVRIQYMESDTRLLRIIHTGQITKRISLEKPYKVDWVWKPYRLCTTCIRHGTTR